MENVTKTMSAEGTRLEVRRQGTGAQRGKTYGNYVKVDDKELPSEEDILMAYRSVLEMIESCCQNGGKAINLQMIIASRTEVADKGVSPPYATVGWKFSVPDPE